MILSDLNEMFTGTLLKFSEKPFYFAIFLLKTICGFSQPVFKTFAEHFRTNLVLNIETKL